MTGKLSENSDQSEHLYCLISLPVVHTKRHIGSVAIYRLPAEDAGLELADARAYETAHDKTYNKTCVTSKD